MRQYYGIKVTTILNAAEKLSSDLDYLCSLVEQPDSEFPILNALAYARAVTAVSNHIEFVLEDLSENDLSEDEEYVKLTEDELITMNAYTEGTEASLKLLEEVCGISLQNN